MNYWTRTLFTILLISFQVVYVFSQNATIRGFITDQEDGEPCIYANLYIVGTELGASTDINGFYTITRVPPGEHTLVVTYVGYDSIVQDINVKPGEILSQNFRMQRSSFVLDEAVVSAERQESQTQVLVSRINVTSEQIRQLPSIGSEPDIAQYLQVVPGVTFTGDQGGQLYIRGGSPIQNLVLLDGLVVYNPFHSIGMFSVFDSDIIRNAEIYTGGFNAEYGGRLSSVMDITTRDGNPNRFAGKLSTSTFGAKLLLEGPLVKFDEYNSGISYIVSAKTSFLEQSSQLIYNYINDGQGLPFNYTDIYSKVSLISAGGSRVNLFGFNFTDRVNYQGISNLAWNSTGIGGNFIVVPQGSTVMIKANVSYSDYYIELQTLDNLPSSSGVTGFNMGLDFLYYLGRNSFVYGIHAHGLRTDFDFHNAIGRKISEYQNTTELSFYGKYKYNLGNLIIEPGFRLQWYASLSEFSPEPRLGVKYNLTQDLRLKFAGGLYSQNLVAANSDREVVNLFYGFLSGALNLPQNFKGSPVDFKLQKSQHIIAGIEYDLTRRININAEGYLKNFSQLINLNRNKIYDDTPLNWDKPDYFKKDFVVERGYAYGFDILAKYSDRKMFFWAVYSLGWIKRDDGVVTYTPHYDRRHNVNLVAGYKFGKDLSWDVSGRWNLGSGFPFTQTRGLYELPSLHEDINFEYWNQNGSLGVIYADLNLGRLPYYHRLDISLSKYWDLGEHSQLEANFSVTNVYNRANIFYFDREDFNRVDQLPIMPSIGLNLTF